MIQKILQENRAHQVGEKSYMRRVSLCVWGVHPCVYEVCILLVAKKKELNTRCCPFTLDFACGMSCNVMNFCSVLSD